MHGIVQHALFGVLGLGDIGQRADHAGNLAVGADHRTRLQREPHEMTVRRAESEILHQPAAALVEHAVERCAKTVLVERVQHLEPFRGGAFQRAALEAEQALGFGAGEHLVGRDIPVPDQVAGAGQRQRPALDVGNHARGGAAARKSVLHDGKSDQHHDQHEAAEQRGADDVVGDGTRHRHAGRDHPDHEEEPGRDQQHRAIETVGREIDDQREARERDQHQRHSRDAGGDGGIEQCQRHQRAEEGQPSHGDVGIAHMPAAEVEIGEQEHQQRRGQDRFAGRAPDALGVVRHVEHLAPEAEIDADIDQHRPRQCGGGGEHDAALDHEQDGQHQRQQAGNADHDALVQRERIDLVLVGVGFPQIELRQLVGAQLRDEGDDGAGIERDAEDIRGRALLALRPVAGRRRDGGDARQSEVGPQQPRRHDAIMRRHDQAVELVVGIVGEREHHPVLAAFAGADFDAADDAVGARCGGNLDAVGVAALMIEDRGEIDRGRVTANADRVDSARRGRGGNNHEAQREGRKAPDQTQCQFSAIRHMSGRS